jgi:hypothetical protein
LNTSEFERFFNVANRGEEVKAGTDGETNGNDRKVTSSRSPLEIMFPSNNVVY